MLNRGSQAHTGYLSRAMAFNRYDRETLSGRDRLLLGRWYSCHL